MSRTGVLFQSDRPADEGTTLEILLKFPPPLATVSCSGRVVRTTAGEAGPWTIAATISRYSLVRRPPHSVE